MFASATSDTAAVRAFALDHMAEPTLVRVGAGAGRLPPHLSHVYTVVPPRKRLDAVRRVLYTAPPPTATIVFVDDGRRVGRVVDGLADLGVAAVGLTGEAPKEQRAAVLAAFRSAKADVLVATEVGARGLDVPRLSHVVNLDLPTDGDHYVHRAGRCGRAGGTGLVVNVATPESAWVVGKLAAAVRVEIAAVELRGGVVVPAVRRRRSLQQLLVLLLPPRRHRCAWPRRRCTTRSTGAPRGGCSSRRPPSARPPRRCACGASAPASTRPSGWR